MKQIQSIILFLLFINFGCKNSIAEKPEKALDQSKKNLQSKPLVSFTFDDGNTSDIANFKFEEWNKMILTHLEEKNLKAIFFVTGKNKSSKKGQFLLKSWNDNGHKIANHSYSHPNFNSEKNDSHLFENELKKTDVIISKLSNHIKLFRFPYLKEGQNQTKVDSIRNILSKHNYSNGYVTIDASDWYVDQRLIKRIKQVGLEKADIDRFKDFYLDHILERANYYEKLSYEMNGRHINHTLLLHHNLTSALFLGDLIKKFKEQGWEVIDADKAFEDEIFTKIPTSDFAGESLIYSMAKQSEKYDQILRYPAEDSRYEKNKMDAIGL
ncbi:polysaccharide deacetylase [Aquimarina sp. AD1]|uniref:polysaccharide deacetylase family protein n=1 Tax=Aquimarina sp. (strain AD1) TaxID=1714848 RepID=UPI000E4CB76A|nr:polysaccharide deacetylase family protein [Aquimarina sp. AD1]AXT58177.1 polysaccharide deacetylase [Aquimarina sp. AD1]RKN24656.1 polysaccharide deacetylase [Aquimarina sp. AD1]